MEKLELKNELELIREWASKKGIYDEGDVRTQTLKLFEEAGELSKAIINKDHLEFIDAIGDCVVVLTSIVELGNQYFECDSNYKIEDCINYAYSVISKRKGQMINGSFIKD